MGCIWLFGEAQAKRLQKLQNRAARIIFNAKKWRSQTPIYDHSRNAGGETPNQGRQKIDNWGADIHIFVFTDCKNNRFQKKLMTQYTNIWISAPQLSIFCRSCTKHAPDSGVMRVPPVYTWKLQKFTNYKSNTWKKMLDLNKRFLQWDYWDVNLKNYVKNGEKRINLRNRKVGEIFYSLLSSLTTFQ